MRTAKSRVMRPRPDVEHGLSLRMSSGVGIISPPPSAHPRQSPAAMCAKAFVSPPPTCGRSPCNHRQRGSLRLRRLVSCAYRITKRMLIVKHTQKPPRRTALCALAYRISPFNDIVWKTLRGSYVRCAHRGIRWQEMKSGPGPQSRSHHSGSFVL